MEDVVVDFDYVMDDEVFVPHLIFVYKIYKNKYIVFGMLYMVSINSLFLSFVLLQIRMK